MQSINLNDEAFIPRPSIPFEPLKLPPLPMAGPHKASGLTPPQTYPKPKLAYPILKVSSRPILTARQLAQQNIQKELTELNQKNSLNLDQLIQHAINLKINQDYHPITPPKIIQVASPPKVTPSKLFAKQAVPKVAKRELWWPQQEEVKKIPAVKVTSPVKKEVVPVTLQPKILSLKVTPPAAVPHPIATVAKVSKVITPTVTKLPLTQDKAATDEPQLINYFLFSIRQEENPFDDPSRRRIIFGVKLGGYLVLLLAISEFRRYLLTGLSINGFLEIISILLIAGIFFFFGENFSILFKPTNPYQTQEVV